MEANQDGGKTPEGEKSGQRARRQAFLEEVQEGSEELLEKLDAVLRASAMAINGAADTLKVIAGVRRFMARYEVWEAKAAEMLTEDGIINPDGMKMWIEQLREQAWEKHSSTWDKKPKRGCEDKTDTRGNQG